MRIAIMFGLEVRELMAGEKTLLAPPSTTVAEAAQHMRDKNVGALMVVEGEQLVGIFTERDVAFRVVAEHRDPDSTQLSDVMTVNPMTVDPRDSFGYAMLLMFEHGFRHVPVVVNGKPVGIVSARHALDPDLEEFAAEANRRKAFKPRQAA
ncbi:CBS domain-containing protein [Burkholderiaceae bacterium DAT-1]|nr:CBS domain-containing protein [Burkholderiaceae bacterium DAT-1]